MNIPSGYLVQLKPPNAMAPLFLQRIERGRAHWTASAARAQRLAFEEEATALARQASPDAYAIHTSKLPQPEA